MTVEDELLTLDALVKEKQDELNNIKRSRDQFQSEAKACQARRDSFRKASQDLMRKVTDAKRERDRYNAAVREAKAQIRALRKP